MIPNLRGLTDLFTEDFAHFGGINCIVTSSICSLELMTLRHNFEGPSLRHLHVPEIASEAPAAVNLLMHHGVRSVPRIRAEPATLRPRAANIEPTSPRISSSTAGHGYATVRLCRCGRMRICLTAGHQTERSKNGPRGCRIEG